MTETRESWPFANRHVIRFGVIFLVAMSLSAPGRIAAHAGDEFDQYPLRPADTSSPRDTLNSFLTNLDQAIKAWQTGQPINVRIRIFDRAAGTFDTSGMSESDLRATKIKAALLLKEILDRIALPPDDQIPGDDDVGSGDQALTELGRSSRSFQCAWPRSRLLGATPQPVEVDVLALEVRAHPGNIILVRHYIVELKLPEESAHGRVGLPHLLARLDGDAERGTGLEVPAHKGMSNQRRAPA